MAKAGQLTLFIGNLTDVPSGNSLLVIPIVRFAGDAAAGRVDVEFTEVTASTAARTRSAGIWH